MALVNQNEYARKLDDSRPDSLEESEGGEGHCPETQSADRQEESHRPRAKGRATREKTCQSEKIQTGPDSASE